MNSKTFIVAVLIISLVLSSYLEIRSSESKKINNLTSDTIIIDSNVLVFWNRVIHEWFDDNSLSAMNLLTGTVVNEHDSNKDIQMRASGVRINFLLRSGDQAIRIPGSRTLFGQFIAYDNISESEFDTLSKITNLGPTLEPSDFYRVSTAEYSPSYFNAPLTQNTVYSFYLVDKSTINNIYGMIRLRSAFIQGGEFNLAVDVKLNTAGQNQFRKYIVSIKQLGTIIPCIFILYNNYPNPFNPVTNIRFDIPRSSNVKLIIHDVLGREVATLINEKLSAGRYETEWSGNNYPSGIYFYKLTTDEFVSVKNMLLVK